MAKDCGHHHGFWHKLFHDKLRLFLFCLFVAGVVSAVIVLILYFIYHQTDNLSFHVAQASTCQFTISSGDPPTSPLLTSTFQISLSARNPNCRVDADLSLLRVYVSHGEQSITLPTTLPSTSLSSCGDDKVWYPYVTGNFIPLPPYLAAALSQAKGGGTLALRVKVEGKLTWDANGGWPKRTKWMTVDCPVVFSLAGGCSPAATPLPQYSPCFVHT